MYVNDINRFGRTYQVRAQADAEYRLDAEAIRQLKVRSNDGRMIPLGSFVEISPTTGPDRVMHYNTFVSADINGSPAPGMSSDQAKQAIEEVLATTLPALVIAATRCWPSVPLAPFTFYS